MEEKKRPMPMKDGERPEPPKDENGNPIAPPEGCPEPPKDENGNPIAPPEGKKPPCCMKPPKDGEKPEEKDAGTTAVEV